MILLVLMMIVPAPFAVRAAETADLTGEWVFSYDREIAFITLRADGTALYNGAEYRWEDRETGLFLADEAGNGTELRYERTAAGLIVYLPSLYDKISLNGDEGIVGTWVGVNGSQSSFVFTDTGKFLEDSVFTGDYTVDPENGSVRLVYGQYFADTVFYYSFSGGRLRVAYPWEIVLK